MATIDFSNAVIKPYSEYGGKPISTQGIATSIGASTTSLILYQSPSSSTASTASVTVLSCSPTKLSAVVSGYISSNGIQNARYLYFGTTSSTIHAWEISNIIYSTGDDYSFQIDFDITVS